MNVRDPLRVYGMRVFDQENLLLSPFSLVELNLLRRAKKLEISNFESFSSALSELISHYGIDVLSDEPAYHYQASLFERQFRLTFFGSLHASVSKVEAEVLASFDGAYDRLASSGVKRIDPREL